MESLDVRLHSYAKSKRVKSPKTGKLVTLKWPHSSSFLANPHTLSEAGFFFNPSADHRDSVTCFMCGKELSDWERDDDPFAIHLDKARGSCAWALVRCYLSEDGDGSPDPSMLPSSRTMEKARLETFGSSWPHDAVRSHGANSKKMAKAGFAYTPQSSGDDTASCFYCGTALSGWDVDDDPLEEHRKREAKSDRPCRFLSFLSPTTATSLAASTSSRAKATKSSARPPSRTSSRRKIKPVDEEDDDDELAQDFDSNENSSEEVTTHNGTSRSSRNMKSTGSRTSTIPAKAPASGTQKSGGAGRGKTPTTGQSRKTNTAGSSSHVDVDSKRDDIGSEREQEAGKKVSRSKSKRTLTKSKSKAVVEDIEEEEEESTGAHEEGGAEDDEPEEVVEKPKRRGRPPGSGKRQKEKAAIAAAIAAASQTKEKKTLPSVAPAVEEADPTEDSDIEEIFPLKPKAKYTRTRSKLDLQTESDEGSPITVPSTSKAHSQMKSSTRGKKSHVAMEVEVVVPLPPSSEAKSSTAQGKSKGKQQFQEDEVLVGIIEDNEVKAKERVSRSKPKAAAGERASEVADDGKGDVAATKEKNNHSRAVAAQAQHVAGAPAPSRPTDIRSNGLKRRSSTTSDDAGYATAAMGDHHMDVDVSDTDPHAMEPPIPLVGSPAKKPATGRDFHAKSNDHTHLNPSSVAPSFASNLTQIPPPTRPYSHAQQHVDIQLQPQPVLHHPLRQARPGPSKPATRPSSRPLARTSSRTGHINEHEVVDISSDDEPMFSTPPLPQEKIEDKQNGGKRGNQSPLGEVRREEHRDEGVEDNSMKVITPEASLSTSAQTASQQTSFATKQITVLELGSDVEMTDVQPIEADTTSHLQTQKPIDNLPANDDEHTEISTATPPPHTPSASPRNSEPPRATLPSFDEEFASESQSESFTPFLSLISVQKFSALTEEESDMTIEQFIHREIELQYRQFKEDGERRIALFKEQAAETRRTIEAA